MKRLWHSALIAIAIAICVSANAASAAATNDSTDQPSVVREQKLPANGTLVMDMNIGDLKIVAGPQSDQLRMEVRADAQYDQKTVAGWVKRFDVSADRASIEIDSPKHNNCNDCGSARVVLYIPAQTNLKVKLEIGDLNIQGIRGNKEVSVRIGDLHIGYRNPDEYAHVETTTHIGDVQDSLHSGDSHGFLGASEDFTRAGQYHLRASVWIGDLCLYDEGKSDEGKS